MLGRSVTVRAPAKVNLQLAVGGLREDGFHELANVFLAVSCFDEVTVTLADRPGLTVAGPNADGVPVDDSNLALRAARLLGRQYGIEANLRIHIRKRLPVAGGMAGGSADAAGTLVACGLLWNLGVDRSELVSLAADLGSDVPFSVLGGVAVGYGRGERLRPLDCGGTFHWVFAIARFGLSTPEVYAAQDRWRREAGLPVAAVDMSPPRPSPRLLEAVKRGDPYALAEELTNDLEPRALAIRPQLARTLEVGRAAGALAAILCGTGATIAFLALDNNAAEAIARRLSVSGTCASALVAYGPVPGPAVHSDVGDPR